MLLYTSLYLEKLEALHTQNGVSLQLQHDALNSQPVYLEAHDSSFLHSLNWPGHAPCAQTHSA